MSARGGSGYRLVDHLYAAICHRTRLTPRFFEHGWGGASLAFMEAHTRQMLDEGLDKVSARLWPPPNLSLEWRTVWQTKHVRLQEALLATTCPPEIKSSLPRESLMGRVQWLTPGPDSIPGHVAPSCAIHLAGTGDHGFIRRLRLGIPLLKYGISTMVLESPFYGKRRPSLQSGSRLRCVSDLLLLGRATIDEARALLHWMVTQGGMERVGVCGLSMGGVHAAMVGALHKTPVAIVPMLAPHSAAAAFCDGLLRHGTAWEALEGREARGRKEREGREREIAEEDGGREAMGDSRLRMRQVLELTDIRRFPKPKVPEAAIIVAASEDEYIPRDSILSLHEAWPGSELRWVRGGHVSSFLFHDRAFQKAIYDALSRIP